VREIACDESGYEGEKLIDTTTDVFAHAGVGLDAAAAGAVLRELRTRIRSAAKQYKAGHLREKNRAALGCRRVTRFARPLPTPTPIAGVRYIREGAWMPSSSSPCPRVRAVRSHMASRLPRTGSSVLRTGQAS
jgi:hypothetical protein